jgi:hypothetical protein
MAIYRSLGQPAMVDGQARKHAAEQTCVERGGLQAEMDGEASEERSITHVATEQPSWLFRPRRRRMVVIRVITWGLWHLHVRGNDQRHVIAIALCVPGTRVRGVIRERGEAQRPLLHETLRRPPAEIALVGGGEQPGARKLLPCNFACRPIEARWALAGEGAEPIDAGTAVLTRAVPAFVEGEETFIIAGSTAGLRCGPPVGTDVRALAVWAPAGVCGIRGTSIGPISPRGIILAERRIRWLNTSPTVHPLPAGRTDTAVADLSVDTSSAVLARIALTLVQGGAIPQTLSDLL